MKMLFFFTVFALAPAFVLTCQPVLGQSAVQSSSTKIAVIYSDAFADEKNGIARLSAVRKTLEQEFEPARRDLLKLKTQVDGLEKELRDGSKVPDVNSAASKARLLERLKREFGFRSGEATARSKNAMQNLQGQFRRMLPGLWPSSRRRTGSMSLSTEARRPVFTFSTTPSI